ncbi:MAG: nucleotide pyrophosphohydrolase [Promethearchaeota archaeon]
MKETNSFKAFQQKINNWIQKHGGYWSPLAMLASVTEELGELAREINHLEGFKPKKTSESEVRIGEELADLVFSIICIANYYDINLTRELERVIAKFSSRDALRFFKNKINK